MNRFWRRTPTKRKQDSEEAKTLRSAPFLTSIKEKDLEKYYSICRELARRPPNELIRGINVKVGSDTYRLSNRSLKDIKPFDSDKSPRIVRDETARRHWPFAIIGTVIAALIAANVIAISPLIVLLEPYIRAFGGSIILCASIVFLRNSTGGDIRKAIR